jgi:hypothetical protein
MSRVEIAPEVGDDFERIFDHLAQYNADNAAARIRHRRIRCVGVEPADCTPSTGQQVRADHRAPLGLTALHEGELPRGRRMAIAFHRSPIARLSTRWTSGSPAPKDFAKDSSVLCKPLL